MGLIGGDNLRQDLLDFIVQQLREYKINKEIIEHLQNEDISIEAVALSEMPKSVTNKFHSVTENIALWKREEAEVSKSIKRVESWLRLLNYIEEYVVFNFYIEEWTYNKIVEEWKRKEGIYYSDRFWKFKKKDALKKIHDFYEKKLP